MRIHSALTFARAVLLAAAWSAAGCKHSAPPPADAPEPSATAARSAPGGPGMNVLLVSVDTTRADCWGCYGHPIVKTPNIDQFAAEGTRFAWCISSAPLTLVSHSTMLTGCFQFVHGARDNGLFRLDKQNVTLAEIYKEAGYATHAEVAALVLNQSYGLDQGFDSYGDVSPEEETGPADTFTFAAGGRRERPQVHMDDVPGGACDSHLERKADVITKTGIQLLNKVARGDEPFFIFLHYFDPHQPHEAPDRFASQYKDGYFAEIAFFDEQFGKLMEALRELKLEEKTLVVLTSDHGEGRGQHGEYTHSGFLYDATQHVPLIMRCPGQVPAGRVIESQVRHIDLAPTVLEFTRLQPSPQMHGASLFPMLADSARHADRPAYSDTMVPRHTYGFSPLRALRADGWKYILAPKPELYHVAEDPLELINLAGSQPQRSSEMREQLRSLIAEAPAPPGKRASPVQVDESNLKKLEALGYATQMPDPKDDPLLQGSELDDFEPRGENPRDHVEAMEVMAAAMGAFRLGLNGDAELAARRLLELVPDNPTGLSYLGAALKRQGKYEESIKVLRYAVKVHPDRWRDHRMLGTMLAERGEYAEAEYFFDQAIKWNPADSVSHINKGQLLVLTQRYPEAIIEHRVAAELAPRMADARFHLAMALRLNGEADEAIQHYEEAIRLRPDLVAAYIQLSRTLVGKDCVDDAIWLLQRAVRRMPDRPALAHMLAQCYEEKGDRESAGEQFARVIELDPDRPDVHENYAANLIARGEHAEAVAILDQAAALEPDAVSVLLRLSSTLKLLGRTGEAIQRLSEGLELNQDNPALHRALGDLLTENGEYDRAGVHYARVVELAPDRAIAWRNLGINLLLRGQASEAVERLREADELEPDQPDTLAPLAEALRRAGISDVARQTFEKLIQRSPRRADAYSGLAGLLEDLGQHAPAVEMLRRGIEAVPDSADLANYLAWRLATSPVAQIRNASEAVRFAELANELSGGVNVAVLDTLAAAYAGAGRFDDAVKTAARAINLASEGKDAELLPRIESRRKLYAQRQPYRAG